MIKIFFKKLLSFLGIALVKKTALDRLFETQNANFDLDFISAMPLGMERKILESLPISRSQLRQDLFVLCQYDFKEGGFFVEFGATDGVHLSNTYILETEYGWDGIVAEPARGWHDSLHQNRKCNIEYSCVWNKTGDYITFSEVKEKSLSTINQFSNADEHSNARKNSEDYSVETISLVGLLKKHNAPRVIDYLSIDTEGSEFEILNAFDFEMYDIRIITCEHNHTENRKLIHELLLRKGYQRMLTKISRFDDWYVKN